MVHRLNHHTFHASARRAAIYDDGKDNVEVVYNVQNDVQATKDMLSTYIFPFEQLTTTSQWHDYLMSSRRNFTPTDATYNALQVSVDAIFPFGLKPNIEFTTRDEKSSLDNFSRESE